MNKNTFIIAFTLLTLTYSTNSEAQNWIETSKSLPMAVEDYQHYGISVSVDGNYAVIGSEFNHNRNGCAYVMFFDGSNWVLQAKLFASDSIALVNVSVSISGDQIIIGAPWDNVNGTQSGSAYVFTKPISGWTDTTETAKLLPSDGTANDRFGCSVSISGHTIVIGSSQDDDNGVNSGSAYVFTQPPTGWTDTVQTAKLLASDGAEDHEFGTAVSISGDNIVVGSINDSCGSAYIFVKPGPVWSNMTETAKITASDGDLGNQFGYSVSISGNDVVVGAPFDNDNGFYSGSAYVFTKPAAGWKDTTETAKLLSSDGDGQEFFGVTSCISDNNIVIGLIHNGGNGGISGSVYVFSKPLGGWTDTTETEKLMASDGESDDFFGWSASISGNHIVIGAAGDAEYGNEAGSAYLFINCQTNAIIYPEVCNDYLSPSGNHVWTSSGIYYDTIPNTAGCDSLITVNLTIHTVDVSVTNTSPTLTANASGATYQWLDCNNSMAIIPGETAQSFTALSNGSYAVQVTQNSCTDTSDCEAVTNAGILENSFGNALTVYPNPTKGEIYIDLGVNYIEALFIVRNVLGQEVMKKSFYETGVLHFNIPGEAGIYFVEIMANDKRAILRVMKE